MFKKPSLSPARRAILLIVALTLITGLLLPLGHVLAEPLEETAPKKPPKTIYTVFTRNSNFDTKGLGYKLSGLSFTRRQDSSPLNTFYASKLFYIKWYPTEKMGIFSAKEDAPWISSLITGVYLDRIIFCLEGNELIEGDQLLHPYRERTKEGLAMLEKTYYADKSVMDFAGQVDAYLERFLPKEGGSGAIRQYAMYINTGQVLERENLHLAEKAEDSLDHLLKSYDSSGNNPDGNQQIYDLTTEAHLMGLRSENHPKLSFKSLGDGVYELESGKGFAVPGMYTVLPEGSGAKMDDVYSKPLERDNPMINEGEYPLQIRLEKGKFIEDIQVKIVRPNYAMDQEWVIYASPEVDIAESDQLIGKPVTDIVDQEEAVILEAETTNPEKPKEEESSQTPDEPKEEKSSQTSDEPKEEESSNKDGFSDMPEDKPTENLDPKPSDKDNGGNKEKPKKEEPEKEKPENDEPKKEEEDKKGPTPEKDKPKDGEGWDQPGGIFSPIGPDGKLKDNWWAYAKYYDPDSKENLRNNKITGSLGGGSGSRSSGEKSPKTGEGIALLPLLVGSGVSGLGIFYLRRGKKHH